MQPERVGTFSPGMQLKESSPVLSGGGGSSLGFLRSEVVTHISIQKVSPQFYSRVSIILCIYDL